MEKGKKIETIVPIEDVMNRKLVKLDANSSALDVAKKMAEKGVGSVLLVDSGKGVGILTERDLARNVCAKDALSSKTPATAIMSAPIVTIDKNSAVETAAELMIKNGVRHLAVEGQNEEIVGMISTTDLAKYLRKRLDDIDIESTILDALYSEDYPNGREASENVP